MRKSIFLKERYAGGLCVVGEEAPAREKERERERRECFSRSLSLSLSLRVSEEIGKIELS